jgi:hypothetical protein
LYPSILPIAKAVFVPFPRPFIPGVVGYARALKHGAMTEGNKQKKAHKSRKSSKKDTMEKDEMKQGDNMKQSDSMKKDEMQH